MSKSSPNSYKDPYWSDISSAAEKKIGLPDGLLVSILLNGEKSNANQVSKAKAKTPFQIIPKTRDDFLKKYGVDAYISPENSAEVAALVLKEGLDRNKGNIEQAIGEYHGGPKRKNWGPINKAYRSRVLSGLEDTNIDNISAGFNEWLEKNKNADEKYNSKTKRLLGELSGQQESQPDNSIDKISAGFQKWKTEQDKNNSVKQENQSEPGLLDKAVGAGEAALTTLTGASGGALGMVAGGVEGVAKSILDGTYGTQQGVRQAEQLAAQRAADLTYAPRTEKGQEYAENVGHLFQQMIPIAPLAGEAAIISAATRSAAPALRAGAGITADIAKTGATKAADLTKPIIAQTVEKIKSGPRKVGNAVGLVDPLEIVQENIGGMPRGAAAEVPQPIQPLGSTELAQTAKKAAEGGLGSNKAKQILAEQASPDLSTIKAAERLGISEYLQPDHVTTNQSYRELAQAVKSIPGSEARSAELQGLAQVAKRADDLITEIGGSHDLAQVSSNVKKNLESTVSGLESQAENLYSQLRKNIPAKTDAPAPNVLKFIEQQIEDLGGKENLSPMERKILARLSPKKTTIPVKEVENYQNMFEKYGGIGDIDKSLDISKKSKVFSDIAKKEGFSVDGDARGKYLTLTKNLGKDAEGYEKEIVVKARISDHSNVNRGIHFDENDINIAPDDGFSRHTFEEAIAKLKSATVDNDLNTVFIKQAAQPDVKHPTYALLDKVRRELTSARIKNQGPFKDSDVGLIKKLETELKKDQRQIVDRFGMTETFDSAQKVVAVRKSLENDLVSLFGKNIDGSIVGDLSGAVKTLPSGDVSKFVNLIKSIPQEMRQETVASGLATAFGKSAKQGEINFNSYAKWYEGLLKNKQAHSALMANLPSTARKKLSDLYRVSKSISLASKERITTGRLQSVTEALKGADTFMQNIYGLAKRSASGVAIEAITTPIGLPGSGLAAGIAAALVKGKSNVFKAADSLISSPEFILAVKLASKGDKKQAAIKLSRSKSFNKFVKSVGNPKEMADRQKWILDALQTIPLSGYVTSSVVDKTNTNKF